MIEDLCLEFAPRARGLGLCGNEPLFMREGEAQWRHGDGRHGGRHGETERYCARDKGVLFLPLSLQERIRRMNQLWLNMLFDQWKEFLCMTSIRVDSVESAIKMLSRRLRGEPWADDRATTRDHTPTDRHSLLEEGDADTYGAEPATYQPETESFDSEPGDLSRNLHDSVSMQASAPEHGSVSDRVSAPQQGTDSEERNETESEENDADNISAHAGNAGVNHTQRKRTDDDGTEGDGTEGEGAERDPTEGEGTERVETDEECIQVENSEDEGVRVASGDGDQDRGREQMEYGWTQSVKDSEWDKELWLESLLVPIPSSMLMWDAVKRNRTRATIEAKNVKKALRLYDALRPTVTASLFSKICNTLTQFQV